MSQTENAKARKVASEKRMLALETHAAELESKLTRYRSKMDGQLKARPTAMPNHLHSKCFPLLVSQALY